MSFPARSRYVRYNRLSPLGPVSSIHSSNPFQIQLPRNSEPYKTRQVESPRAEGLHTFAKSSLDPTQISCEFFHGSPHTEIHADPSPRFPHAPPMLRNSSKDILMLFPRSRTLRRHAFHDYPKLRSCPPQSSMFLRSLIGSAAMA